MTIKTFKDGDRFVLVFEGLENSPSTEDMIKSIVSTVIAQDVISVPDAVAKPVPAEKELPPEERFADGTFAGKTKSEALAYLKKRFCNTDADEYASRLTDGQKKAFFSQMGQMIPEGENDISKIIKTWKES